MIFETHCHLNDEALLPDYAAVIERAVNVGVSKMIVVGWDKESSYKAVEIAEKYDFIYAAIGFHPMNIYDLSEDDFNDTFLLITHPKVVAIGEIGLDYHWEKDPERKNVQKKYFVRQIDIANQHGKPVIIHNRDAFGDCLPLLKENPPLYSGTMHCYGGPAELLNDVFNLGLLIGLDGPVTFKNAKTPKEVARLVPLEKLLLETDCPYMAPVPHRGEKNEPMYLPLIAKEIAEIKGMDIDDLCAATYKNACRLFGV